MTMDKSPACQWTLGPVLTLLGFAAVLFALRMDHPGLGNNHDPGPQAFPLMLGWSLVAGGLWEILNHLRARSRRASVPTTEVPKPTARPFASRLNRERLHLLLLLPALLIYIIALPWLGFIVSTLLFASGMMIRLGVGWKWSIPPAAVLVAGIHLLFVQAFKVSFPAGAWEWPW